MGLDTSSVMFLCGARKAAVDFSAVATIGRQSFFPDPRALRRVFRVLGIDRDARRFAEQHRYSEEFLTLLGARHVDSIDVSPYEGATILHDMNQPIAPEWHERFSLVHDGGTLEHVFNFTQALRNCMEMVRVGGFFTQVSVANNFTGHGFWQVSPELVFRAFSDANGFELHAVLMHEVVPDGKWYVVADPDQVRWRVELCNSRPTYILTIARRVARRAIFHQTPLQSDYVTLWNRTLAPPPDGGGDVGPMTWRTLVPEPMKEVVRSVRRRLRQRRSDHVSRGFPSSRYQRISEDQLLYGQFKGLCASGPAPGTSPHADAGGN